MKNKKISDAEAFVKEVERARKIRPTPEEIDYLNYLIHEDKIEEEKNKHEVKHPNVAKDHNYNLDSIKETI